MWIWVVVTTKDMMEVNIAALPLSSTSSNEETAQVYNGLAIYYFGDVRVFEKPHHEAFE